MRALILVVEDDDDTRELFVDVLTEAGYGVMAAANSERAYQLLQTRRPTLAILDLMINGRNAGVELARSLRRDPVTSTVPVLLCSAYVLLLEAYCDELHGIGCDTLVKPFTLARLLTKVEAAIAV